MRAGPESTKINIDDEMGVDFIGEKFRKLVAGGLVFSGGKSTGARLGEEGRLRS